MELLRKKLSPYQHFIWDWNGTLLEDVQQIWEATIQVLTRFNKPGFTKEVYRREFCLPLSDYYQKVGFDLEHTSYREIAEAFQEEYLLRYKEAKLFAGTIELIEQLNQEGKSNVILSASSQGFLDHNVEHFGIRQHFSHIYGVANHLAQGKGLRGLEMLRETALPTERTLLIGDTDHDLAVGQEMGIAVLLIADGHQNFERLSSLHHNVLSSRYAPIHSS